MSNEEKPAAMSSSRLDLDLLDVEALEDVPETGRRDNRAVFTVSHHPADVADHGSDEEGVSQ